MSTVDLDAIEAALSKAPGQWVTVSRLSFAAMVAELRELRGKVADAWDDGYRNGYSIGFKDDPAALTCYENPYRQPCDHGGRTTRKWTDPSNNCPLCGAELPL